MVVVPARARTILGGALPAVAVAVSVASVRSVRSVRAAAACGRRRVPFVLMALMIMLLSLRRRRLAGRWRLLLVRAPMAMWLGGGGPKELTTWRGLDPNLMLTARHRELEQLLRATAQRRLHLAELLAALPVLISRRPAVRRLKRGLPALHAAAQIRLLAGELAELPISVRVRPELRPTRRLVRGLMRVLIAILLEQGPRTTS